MPRLQQSVTLRVSRTPSSRSSAWSAPAQHLLKYIPQPNIGSNLFSTSAFPQTVRDDKGGTRIDANTRLGQISGYYFVDNYQPE